MTTKAWLPFLKMELATALHRFANNAMLQPSNAYCLLGLMTHISQEALQTGNDERGAAAREEKGKNEYYIQKVLRKNINKYPIRLQSTD